MLEIEYNVSNLVGVLPKKCMKNASFHKSGSIFIENIVIKSHKVVLNSPR